jgi:hypothetical protein
MVCLRSLRELVTPYKNSTLGSLVRPRQEFHPYRRRREIRGLDREVFLIQDQADRERHD